MKVSIIGSGVFALANANNLINNGLDVLIWSESKDTIDKVHDKDFQIKSFGKNIINKNFKFTTDMELCLKNSTIIFIMVSVKYLEETLKNISKFYQNNMYICIGSKGIDNKNYCFCHQLVQKYINTRKIAVISGPSFAIDLINNEPIGFSLASKSKDTRLVIKNAIQSKNVKVRETTDILGVEICGSIKNVIAIASGIISGLGYKESTQAFFITESMHDIKELLAAVRGSKNTINSFAGIGDLLLTCTSTKSRNYTFGTILASRNKKKIADFLEKNTVEGYYTIKSIYKLLKKKKIKIPVINIIYNIVENNYDPECLINFLITKK